MIAVITGGTGFVGKNLVTRLCERGDKVRVLSRQNHYSGARDNEPEFLRCDLTTASSSELAEHLEGADVLFNCAGQLLNRIDMRELHVNGTRRLAEAARGNIKRWVQLSSVGVYGPVSRGIIDESNSIRPKGEYEITKADSEVIVAAMAQKYGFEYSILRPSNIYANSMTNQSLCAMINMIRMGLFFYIGKSGAAANYIHVDNVVDGLLLCASHESASGHAFNLSDSCDLESFVDIISKNLGVASPKLRLPEAFVRLIAVTFGWLPKVPLTTSRVNALTSRAVYSIDKIQARLGYSPSVSMEKGLKDFVEHCLEMQRVR